MYRELEIGKARVALLENTNMVEYTTEEFKRVFPSEAGPEGRNEGRLVTISHYLSSDRCEEAV